MLSESEGGKEPAIFRTVNKGLRPRNVKTAAGRPHLFNRLVGFFESAAKCFWNQSSFLVGQLWDALGMCTELPPLPPATKDVSGGAALDRAADQATKRGQFCSAPTRTRNGWRKCRDWECASMRSLLAPSFSNALRSGSHTTTLVTVASASRTSRRPRFLPQSLSPKSVAPLREHRHVSRAEGPFTFLKSFAPI
jgi:hypothetical protein